MRESESSQRKRAIPDQFVAGPVLALAARIRRALDDVELQEDTSYGTFYVSRIEIAFDDETCFLLVPDEGDGRTLDGYTVRFEDRDQQEETS